MEHVQLLHNAAVNQVRERIWHPLHDNVAFLPAATGAETSAEAAVSADFCIFLYHCCSIFHVEDPQNWLQPCCPYAREHIILFSHLKRFKLAVKNVTYISAQTLPWLGRGETLGIPAGI